jgi:hypothetical protein
MAYINSGEIAVPNRDEGVTLDQMMRLRLRDGTLNVHKHRNRENPVKREGLLLGWV